MTRTCSSRSSQPPSVIRWFARSSGFWSTWVGGRSRPRRWPESWRWATGPAFLRWPLPTACVCGTSGISGRCTCLGKRCADIVAPCVRARGKPAACDAISESPREGRRVRTYSPKASEITREWHVVDAEGLVLGRLATEVARILRGKHKTIFSPHIDTADKVVLTKGKADVKMVYDHSGYPGGISSSTYAERLDRKPADAVRRTVRG